MRRNLLAATLGFGCLGLGSSAAHPAAVAQGMAATHTAAAATPDGAAGGGQGSWRPDGKGHGVFSPDAPPVQAVPQAPEAQRPQEPQEPQGPQEPQLPQQQPPRKPHDSTLSNNGILYHGGPVMLGTTHVYLIFYGNWTSSSATTILPDWAANVGGSPYFNTNTTYSDGSNHSISNSATFGGAIFDNYSRGSALDDNGVGAVVSTAIGNGSLPLDAHGVYFVLTSSDVAETSGFCTQYCGWHGFETVQSVPIKYSFVGDSTACPFSCEGVPGNAPNGNEGADGMASIMAHELNESVTDPELDAWYDSNGNEVGDLCSWIYGSTYTTGNNSVANVHLGARDFLLQENWVNAGGGYCAAGLAAPSAFYTVTPCRLIDTRNPAGPAGGPALQAGQTRAFALAGSCGIPAGAKALSVNVTVTQPAAAGFLSVYAVDEQPGSTSTINFLAGQTVANNALLRLSGDGSGTIAVIAASAGAVQMILDVNGYFQ